MNTLETIKEQVYSTIDTTKLHTFIIKNTKEYLIVISGKNGGAHVCRFIMVKKYQDDDDMSLLVGISQETIRFISGVPNGDIVYKKYLVTFENSGLLINKLLLDESVDDLLYKNKPKIKSSMYGAQLYDIVVLTG